MTVLVIDIGSSSTRALLCDDAAQPIAGAIAQRKYTFATRPHGAATVEAQHLRDLTEACIDDVLQHPAASNIRVAGMACFAGSLLGTDARYAPLTPVYTYADTRSADHAKQLGAELDENTIRQRTGVMLHSAYVPAQVRWLCATQPDVCQQIAHWLDFATYLYAQWFGQAACSYSLASWSGLLNRASCTWDADLLAQLPLHASQLPALQDYDAMQQGLRASYAERWPALADVPFCLAVGDGAAANVGSGAVEPGRIALTLGTTAALRTVSTADVPSVPPGLWSYRIDRPHHLIGGATSEGGNMFAWATQTLALPEGDLDAMLLAQAPDEHGLTFLPLLAGERSPGWHTHARGTLHGLRMSTTPLDMLQAGMEGVALRIALIAEQLIIPSAVQVLAGGGAIAASRAWRQFVASALGVPLHIIADDEMTARGVAILALHALGDCALTDYPPNIGEIIEPEPARQQAFTHAKARQLDLYNLLYTDPNDN